VAARATEQSAAHGGAVGQNHGQEEQRGPHMAGCVRLGSRQEPPRRKKTLLIGFGCETFEPVNTRYSLG
jgi:hypothetical protein